MVQERTRDDFGGVVVEELEDGVLGWRREFAEMRDEPLRGDRRR